MNKAAELLKNPKVRQVLLVAGAYAAGAHGGPVAGNAVKSYGPTVLDLLVKLLGG